MTAVTDLQAQILWHRLIAVVEEQAQTLIRTAFSTTVREAGDLSAGVFDDRGRMLAQAVTGTPGHVNAMAASVGAFLRAYPLDTLGPGDVLVTNDPWDGTGHLNDFTVVTPVFRAGRAIALFAATTHIADVGGLGFGPQGRSVYEEGLLIPIAKLFERGRLNDTLMAIVRANVRDPVAAEGDLYSLAACNRTGAERLAAMLDDFGLADLNPVAETILARSDAAMRAEIAKLPQTRVRHTMRIDGHDAPLDLVCTLSVADETVHIDWTGSSPLAPRGVNVPLTYTQAYSAFGVRVLIGAEVPNNHASLARVVTTAPEGCVLNAPRPAPVSARHAIGQMLPDVVLGCLAQLLPDRVPAEGAGCLWNPVLLGGPGQGLEAGQKAGRKTGQGADLADQEGEAPGDPGPAFVINPFHTGGMGARPDRDGLDCTAFPSGVRSTPVEIYEATAPVIVWRKEFRPGSGGAGRFRGGMGQVMEFGHADDRPFAVSRMFDRLVHPPRGRAGGGDGAPGRAYLSDGTELSGMGRDVVPAGVTFTMETPGGGGYGDPAERAADAAARDARDGIVGD
ncbi:hydantoinase B/oxoprolinase family protein [Rhodothalassium salexigens]|uniref:hydantoinase B/oxoprolinase family protein n=1 Tax=Rhodothalassium salexigens TaxID=1086 RepID=UPI001914D5EC|nr:hydantoinase B/oxoprolinase family protein [Rhodothalassium salexigens]